MIHKPYCFFWKKSEFKKEKVKESTTTKKYQTKRKRKITMYSLPSNVALGLFDLDSPTTEL